LAPLILVLARSTPWTLPEADADFATRWRLIKSEFSRHAVTGERISASRAAKGEPGIRQRRYREHTIRDENDFTRHIDYVHAAGIELSPRQNKLDSSTRSCFTTTIDRA
jgi:REP element-mobilizing transposase RayT